MENEYALRLKDAVAAERLRDLTDRCARMQESTKVTQWCTQVKQVAMENEYALRLKHAVAAERLRNLADRCARYRQAQ